MTPNQRAARYVFALLLTRIMEEEPEVLLEAVAAAEEEIKEHVREEVDVHEVLPLVRRYAELLATEVGFAAEQGILERLTPEYPLDRPHYTDMQYGYPTKEEAMVRLAQFYPPGTDLEQRDNGRWIIVPR